MIDLAPVVTMVIFAVGATSIILFWRRNPEPSPTVSYGTSWLMVVVGWCLIVLVFGVWRIQATQSEQGILTEFVPIGKTDRGSSISHPNQNLEEIGTDKSIEITVKGYVSKESEMDGDKQKVVLTVKEYSVPGYTNSTNEKVLITLGPYPSYKYGQVVNVTGTLNIPDFKDGDFDYQKYLARDGIYTTMFNPEVEPTEIELPRFEGYKIALLSGVFKFKNTFESAVEQSISEPSAGFINGILLGSRSQIPQDLKDDFARTSMSHVLAISGFNITIIASIISNFFLWFVRRPTAFWFSLAAVVLFTIMTGAQAAVVRAAIMGTLILLARREGRAYHVHNAIILAAVVMIYFNPLILRNDIGFQLSFAATMGIVFLGPKLERYLEKVPEFFNLKETLVMSISAQIMVLPLILHYFENLSIVSLPANLLVLPSIPYTMLLGFMTGMAGMIWPFLGQLIGYFAWLLSIVEIKIVRALAQPSFAAITISFNWTLVVLTYVLIIAYIKHDRKHNL